MAREAPGCPVSGLNGRLCLALCTGGEGATESRSSEAEPGASVEPLWPPWGQSNCAPGSELPGAPRQGHTDGH